MEWYVYYYDMNEKRIEPYNVLGGKRMPELIKRLRKKFNDSKEGFSEELRVELMRHYWSRSEWEIIISAWCGGDGCEETKIDVYDQVKMNWNSFIDYCWNYNILSLEQ